MLNKIILRPRAERATGIEHRMSEFLEPRLQTPDLCAAAHRIRPFNHDQFALEFGIIQPRQRRAVVR